MRLKRIPAGNAGWVPMVAGSPVEFRGLTFAARGISARGPRGCAFANVSLDIGAGQLAVLAGPAGSGRTSLLLTLAGRMRLVTGTLAVGEHRLPGATRRVQRLVAVAHAPPAVDFDEHLRVREVIAEQGIIGHFRPTAAVVQDIFEMLGVDAPPGLRVGELPPEQRVLLAAGLAAAGQPGAVVVDDVDRDCGATARPRVWAGLAALAGRGCTVLASSTDIPDLPERIVATVLPHPSVRDVIDAASKE